MAFVKKILLALGFMALAQVANAQVTLSVPLSAQEQADTTAFITDENARTCLRLSRPGAVLTETCTQAQACVNANAVGGASCTIAQARQANARIYPTNQAGLEEFVRAKVLADRLADAKPQIRARNRAKECAAWEVATLAQKNARCAAANAVDPTVPATVAAGCDLGCN